jgi:methylmalonyl-CoA/ethylmalonyl-CoA epimerase
MPLGNLAKLRFDHIGVVVKDIPVAIACFDATFGIRSLTDRFDDDGLRVSVQFLRDHSGVVYEMISPRGANSPVAKTLASNNNLLNQIAYRTPALKESDEAMRQAGHFALGPPAPALAFGGAKVQFFWCELGFVIELVEGFDTGPVFRDSR